MPDDDTDYIAMLERTQIPEDHPLIRFLVVDIKLADSVCQIDKEWPKCYYCGSGEHDDAPCPKRSEDAERFAVSGRSKYPKIK